MRKNELIKFGTCSWKYDSWRGIIYPEKGNFNYLKEYSKFYSTVEVDQWFWSLFGNKIKLPNKKDVLDYHNSTPDNFEFTLKAPNSITLKFHHQKIKTEKPKENPFFLSSELYNEFLNSIEELSSKVTVIMLQFEYLNKQKMKSLTEFLRLLEQFITSIPRNISLGIEIRNPNYLNEDYFNFLYNYDIIHVFLHGYYMPPIWEIYDKFKDKIKNPVVIRLHGPNREEIEKESKGEWNKILFPKNEEIKIIVEILKDLEKRKIKTYVNVNNHYEGCAPLTISRIQELL